MNKHYLPSKAGAYLKRLQLEYERLQRSLMVEVIGSAHFYVREGANFYQHWNDGVWGHDCLLFLPVETMRQISVQDQEVIQKEICEALNTFAANVSGECFDKVVLGLADEGDPDFHKSIRLSHQAFTNPDNLTIWRPGHLRLFISHRDNKKVQARMLADELASYGVSAFVAHESIEPMSKWQHEIMKGLETMDVMLVFVTDDFHESFWANQEIGYALGKGVPIISVKYETRDPPGFIGEKQALKGRLDLVQESAPEIFKIMAEKLGQRARLQRPLIAAFVASPDFTEARRRFDRLAETISTLTDDEVAEIQIGYRENDQLHNAIYLNNQYNRLTNFLRKCTGKRFEISGKDIEPEIPF